MNSADMRWYITNNIYWNIPIPPVNHIQVVDFDLIQIFKHHITRILENKLRVQ
jgi:hypothetical protein